MEKILIIDDDVLICKMVKRRLEILGYNVEYTNSASKGIENALSSNYDLVLMDMFMPDISGFKATKELRNNNFKGIICALSASVTTETKEKSLESGCNAFLSKPLDKRFEENIKELFKKNKKGE